MMSEQEKIKFIKENEGLIMRVVSKYCNYRKSDFEDLLQEGKMAIYKDLDNYDENKGALSTFCYTSVRNRIYVVSKSYSNWDRTDMNNEAISKIEGDNTFNRLYSMLKTTINYQSDKFTKTELQVLYLLADKKSFQEIDSILGITTNNRLQVIYNIKRKLKNIMENNNDKE